MPQLVFNPLTGDFDFVRRVGEGQVFGALPSGVIDGVNTAFTTPGYFVEGSLEVYYNGQRLRKGASNDYTVLESGGIGTGFDTINLTFAPRAAPKVDVITVDYLES